MKYTKGTYSSSAKGHSSNVNLTVNFDSDKIKNVSINVEGETSQRNKDVVSQLSAQILKKQDDSLDAVTGATETSNAVRRALTDCIKQATGDTENQTKTPLKDGTYTETVPSYSLIAPMTGEVTIKNNKIKNIKITSEKDSQTSPWFHVAEK